MLKMYLENILLGAIPTLAVCQVYDMSLHSLLALVLIHENSTPKYYVGSGMILLTSYTYFSTHEHMKILFSIFLAFSLLGCGFSGDMKRFEDAYSVHLRTGSCEVEEVLLPASPAGESNCPQEDCPSNHDSTWACNCNYAPAAGYMDWVKAPAPVEAPAPAPADHHVTERRRPRVVVKLSEDGHPLPPVSSKSVKLAQMDL